MKKTDSERDEKELGDELGPLLMIAAGPVIWTLHFLVVYCTGAVLCERLPTEALPILRWLVAGLTVAALVALVWLLRGAWRKWDYYSDLDVVHGDSTDEDRDQFLGHSAFLLTGLSIIGVVFMALPPVFIGTCR